MKRSAHRQQTRTKMPTRSLPDVILIVKVISQVPATARTHSVRSAGVNLRGGSLSEPPDVERWAR
jgi:hypothetical protein